jgi:plasmid stabilization system protein ParE
VSHRIEFSPEALGDLIDLYDYIALRDGAERAIGYIDRIENCCRNLSMFRTAASGATIYAAAYGFSVSNAAQ